MAAPETAATTPVAAPDTGETLVRTQQTQEVIGLDKAGGETTKNLSSIFDKMESGTKPEEAISEVMAKKPAEVRQEKKEEKVIEQKTEAQKSELDKKLEDTEAKKTDEEDISREALRKSTEENKPEVKVETKPSDELTDADLVVLPTDKPKTVKRIEALLKERTRLAGLVTETKKEADAKNVKLLELEEKLKTVKTVDPKTEEAIQKAQDELAMYRRRYDLENDPDVKIKYDDRIAAADKPVPDILKRNGASAELLKIIEDEGGWSSFAQSSRAIPTGEGKMTTAADLADTIVNALPVMDRKAIEASMVEKIQLSREKARFFEEEKAKSKDYFTKQAEQQKLSREQQQKQIQDSVKAIEDWQKKTLEENDFLKEKPIPADANESTKKAIEEDNRYTKQLQGLLRKSTNAKDMTTVLDMVLDSVKYYDERRRTVRLAEENKLLKEELKSEREEKARFKTASKSTTKAGSIAAGASGATEASRPQTKKAVGLEEVFARMERGERPEGGTIITSDDET